MFKCVVCGDPIRGGVHPYWFCQPEGSNQEYRIHLLGCLDILVEKVIMAEPSDTMGEIMDRANREMVK